MAIQFDEHGFEIVDPIPIEIPARFRHTRSADEQIKALIRGELSRLQEQNGQETFEDANDFEVDEDPDPVSQYELRDMADEYPPNPIPKDSGERVARPADDPPASSEVPNTDLPNPA